MFQNEQNFPFADAQLQKKPVQAEQLERRISLFKNKQLWYEIVKGLLRIFFGFVHHEFSHKHVIVADLISRLEKKRIFQN